MDRNAEAYGLFLANFAWLADRLAAALLHLGGKVDEKTYKKLMEDSFTNNVKTLQSAINSHLRDPLRTEATDICKRMTDLAYWRNDRIHARLDPEQMQSGRIVLYSWRTRRPLSMEADELRAKATEAFTLAFEVAKLHQEIANNREWDTIFEQFVRNIDHQKID